MSRNTVPAGRAAQKSARRVYALSAVLAAAVCLPLFFSCASSAPAARPEEPFSVLLPSAEGLSPAGYFVIPPALMRTLLREELLSGADAEAGGEGGDSAATEIDASTLETLDNFFSRAESVSAVAMLDRASGGVSFRILALGDFPKGRLNFALGASSGWNGFKIGDTQCFTSGGMFLAVPVSGVFTAVFSSGSEVSGVASMTDILGALDAPSLAQPADIPPSFGTVALASWNGEEGAPLAMYAPDVTSALPVFLAGNPLVNLRALSSLGLRIPLDSAEIYVYQGARAGTLAGAGDTWGEGYTVDARFRTASELLAAPAGVLLRMAFPGTEISVEDQSFFLRKTIDGRSLALAVLSLFLVS